MQNSSKGRIPAPFRPHTLIAEQSPRGKPLGVQRAINGTGEQEGVWMAYNIHANKHFKAGWLFLKDWIPGHAVHADLRE